MTGTMHRLQIFCTWVQLHLPLRRSFASFS